MNAFIINEIEIKIGKIVPVSINNENNFIEKILVEYIFDFTEAADPEFNLRMIEKIIIDVQEYKPDVFVEIEEINAEFFNEVVIKLAETDPTIIKRVNFIRKRRGLDIEKPIEIPVINPFLNKPL